MAQGQHLILFFPVNQVVVILHGDEARPAVLLLERQRLGKLSGMHGRGADIARFAGFHHLVQRFERLFNRGGIVPAVDLQQVDIVHPETAQAVVDGAQDLRPGKSFRQIADLVIHLGGDNHLVTAGKVAQGAANDLFAAAVGVAICGIEEVDAAVNGALDDRAAALFRQRPGMISPVRLAKRHASQAKPGHLKVRFS